MTGGQFKAGMRHLRDALRLLIVWRGRHGIKALIHDLKGFGARQNPLAKLPLQQHRLQRESGGRDAACDVVHVSIVPIAGRPLRNHRDA